MECEIREKNMIKQKHEKKYASNNELECIQASTSEMKFLDIIFNKRHESFVPSYSQSYVLADFKENLSLVWFLKHLQSLRNLD